MFSESYTTPIETHGVEWLQTAVALGVALRASSKLYGRREATRIFGQGEFQGNQRDLDRARAPTYLLKHPNVLALPKICQISRTDLT